MVNTVMYCPENDILYGKQSRSVFVNLNSADRIFPMGTKSAKVKLIGSY